MRNHVIYRAILQYCSPLTLLRFKRTCRLASAAVEDYMKLAFNINRCLARFFDDPVAFRSLQARTGTVISGSAALQFFDRTLYADAGMHVNMFVIISACPLSAHHQGSIFSSTSPIGAKLVVGYCARVTSSFLSRTRTPILRPRFLIVLVYHRMVFTRLMESLLC